VRGKTQRLLGKSLPGHDQSHVRTEVLSLFGERFNRVRALFASVIFALDDTQHWPPTEVATYHNVALTPMAESIYEPFVMRYG
jgi:hypothetical protein